MAMNLGNIKNSLKRDDARTTDPTTPPSSKEQSSQPTAAEPAMPKLMARYRSSLKKGVKEVTVKFGDVAVTYRSFKEFIADVYSADFPKEVEIINTAVKAGLSKEDYQIVVVYKSTKSNDYVTDAAQAATKFGRHFEPWAAFVGDDGEVISLCDEQTTEEFLEQYDANATTSTTD